MSYSKFKGKAAFKEVFSVDSPVREIGAYPDEALNMILPSEHLFKSLKPMLEKMLGGALDDKKVVLIPNGGLDQARADMSYVYLQEFTTINNMYLKQLDLEKWPKEILLHSLETCDVICMSGGLVSRLLYAIDKAGIRENLVEIIEKGKPFVGFSAGAMCVSSSTHWAAHFIGESDPHVMNFSPLGLVNFEVYPHFEDNLLPAVEKLLPKGVKGFALRPEDAVVITKGKFYFAGNPVEIN